MKFKHNKKRNTAFLYEVLVRHLTKSVLEGDKRGKYVITSMIKEHFNKKTLLYRELEIFKAINEQKSLDYHLAEKLIFEAKRSYSSLSREDIFRAQSALIASINKNLGKEAYQVFIPNYKSIASIHQILQDQLPLRSKMILEEGYVRKLATRAPKEQETLQPITNIVYRTFVGNFNKQYGESLLQEQTLLLNKYITSFADGGADFKVYINEEIERLGLLVENMLARQDISKDEVVRPKIESVLEVIRGFSDKQVDEAMLEKVLKIQKLVKEF